MDYNIIVLGAGGHAKVIADIIIKTKNKVIGFLDDNIQIGTQIINYQDKEIKVIGKISDSMQLLKENENLKFIIGIGNNNIRRKLAENYKLPYITLIHPSVNISIQTNIEAGSVIMANATINAGAKIGKQCIVNTGAVIEHDNVLEDYVHISPNVALGGTVKVGRCTHIGIGATVRNNINICENSIVGAGAVVVKNIEKEGTYIGIPAKLVQ